MKLEQYETHSGPLKAGDLIVIEISGQILLNPKNKAHQWFVVLTDQKEGESIEIKPHPTIPKHKPTKYICSGYKC